MNTTSGLFAPILYNNLTSLYKKAKVFHEDRIKLLTLEKNRTEEIRHVVFEYSSSSKKTTFANIPKQWNPSKSQQPPAAASENWFQIVHNIATASLHTEKNITIGFFTFSKKRKTEKTQWPKLNTFSGQNSTKR